VEEQKLSDFEAKLFDLVKRIGICVGTVWAVTLLALLSANALRESSVLSLKELQQQEQQKLESEEFDDYIIYHAILPAKATVNHGAQAAFKSDMEIIKIPKGGLPVEWREWIECDHTPYDDVVMFEYWAAAQSTDAVFTERRLRLAPEELDKKNGFPVTARGRDGQVTYPNHDADCRLQSFMTQTHKYDIEHHLAMASMVVEVRGS